MRLFLAIFCSCLIALAINIPDAAATPAPPLAQLLRQLDSLANDEKRAVRRDQWLAMEKSFAALQEQSSGETQAKAAYYHAYARERLSQRSALRGDYEEAASRYDAVAQKYSKYAVTTAALYRQGVINTHQLNDYETAIYKLQLLVRGYPKAPERKDAEKLLADAAKKEAAQKEKNKKAKVSTPDTSSSITVKNIRWKGKEQRAVITLELDTAAGFEYTFVPPDTSQKTPGRLHLDIQGASLATGVKTNITPKKLVVSRIRTGQSGDGTRITLDCTEIACYIVRTPKNAPQTIEIELSRKNDIVGAVAVSSAQKGQGASSPSSQGKDSTGTKKEDVLKQLGLTVQTIMIDAGHGGKDSGARANGIVENEFTLDMARRVGNMLKKKGFTVYYTRTADTYVSLQDRPDRANDRNVDLFISIHANANKNATVHGLEIYYLDTARSNAAVTVAARENSVSVKEISDLQYILTDFMLSAKLEESHELATYVHRSMLQRLRREKLTAYDNGVRSAPFYVLMGARMPAILVEFGYITNDTDAANLKSGKFLNLQAEGLVNGILEYKQKLAKRAL